MKKNRILLILLILLSINIKEVNASVCTKEAATQIGKIVYRESGADTAPNKEDNFFRRLNVASVVLNNASRRKGSSWYEKIYNLDDNVYGSYSSYKDKDFSSLVDKSKQGEILYISELVLTEQYNLPSNMYLQAEPSIVNKYGKLWTNIGDIYFGYEGETLSSKDVFGNKLKSTTVSYFKEKASSLKLSDYSAYKIDTVCSGKINNNNDNNNNNNDNNNDNNNNNNNNNDSNNNSNSNNNQDKETIELIEACENPDILRIIYFVKILIDIVKIIVPIGLIIIGSIDFSKSVINSDEKEQKKTLNLFIKRLIYAALIFIVPWLVEALISFLGDLTEGVNWTDCINNANSEKIEELEKSQNN